MTSKSLLIPPEMEARWKATLRASLEFETTVRVSAVDRINYNGKAYIVELSVAPEKAK